MKIISRYVLRQLLPIFFLALFSFVGLYLVVDFFEKVDNMLEKHVSFEITFLYFLYKVPGIAAQGIPMSFLLATLIALGILQRNRELIALRAAGVRAALYTGPIMAAALLVSVVHFGAGEIMARSMNQKAQMIWQQHVEHVKVTGSMSQENVWYHGRDVIYEIRLYNRKEQILEKVSLFYLDPQFKLVQRLDAKRFRWQDNGWLAEDGLILRFDGQNTEQERFDKKKLDLSETPQDFASIAILPEDLGWLSLYNYVQKIRHEGYDSAQYEVELHRRAAFPLTTVILAFLGIVIASRQGLHGGIAVGVGVALIIASFYLAVLHLGCSLATAGILPPVVGAWAGNVMFAAATGYLKMKEG